MRLLLPAAFAVPIALCCAACATQPTSEPAHPARLARGATCSSFAAEGVSAATTRRLAGASSILEYESIWKAERPGAVSGSAAAGKIRALIHSRLPQLQACYEAVLERARDVSGRVVVRFIIEASGQVAVAHLASNSFDEPEVGCCVVERVAHWTFGPTSGGFVTVEYPFSVRVSHAR